MPQLPNYPIGQFSGPTEICLNINTVYGYSDICKLPSQVTWAVSPNIEIVSQNGLSITVKGIESGSAFVIATFANGKSIKKDIWLGTMIYDSVTEIDPNGYTQFSPIEENGCETIGLKVNFLPNFQNALEYQWEKVTQDVLWQRDFATDGSNRVFIYPICNKNFVFKVKARNSCGWSEWFEVTYAMTNCPSDCGAPFNGIVGTNFILNPNPVSQGIVNVSVKYEAPWFSTPIANSDPNNTSPVIDPGTATVITNYNPIVDVTVYNQLGVALLNFQNVTLPEPLNISNLPQGTYVVLIEYQGQVESYTIIKE